MFGHHPCSFLSRLEQNSNQVAVVLYYINNKRSGLLTKERKIFFFLFLCFSLPSEFGKSRVISKGFLLMSWGRVAFSKRTFVLKGSSSSSSSSCCQGSSCCCVSLSLPFYLSFFCVPISFVISFIDLANQYHGYILLLLLLFGHVTQTLVTTIHCCCC